MGVQGAEQSVPHAEYDAEVLVAMSLFNRMMDPVGLRSYQYISQPSQICV
jgi:hypothetical protein